MKKLIVYVICPVVMFAVFLVFYRSALADMKVRDDNKKAQIAAQKRVDDERRERIEAQAKADAEKRQKAREEEERLKAEKKAKEYQDAIDKLNHDRMTFLAEADKYTEEKNTLELELNRLRTLKERTNTETFALAKQIESLKIERRTAELEIQRLVDMVGQRLNASPLSTFTPPPAPKK